MNELILVGAIAIFALSWYVASLLRKRPLPRCPTCHAKGVSELKRIPKGFRTSTFPGGEDTGDSVRVQQDFEITYHCNQCDYQFTRLVMEMSS